MAEFGIPIYALLDVWMALGGTPGAPNPAANRGRPPMKPGIQGTGRNPEFRPKQTPDHGDECLAAWMQTPAPESCLDELAYCEHGVWVRPDLSPDAKEPRQH